MDDLKLIIEIFGSLLSPIIAIVVAYIAYQQWKVNEIKESRESGKQKLYVYLAVKRFLHSFDHTKQVDRKLYSEMQEALAIGDFVFDRELIDWLGSVDMDAGCFLNTQEIIDSFPNDLTQKERDMLEQEKAELERYESLLEDYHCQLFEKFKGKVIA